MLHSFLLPGIRFLLYINAVNAMHIGSYGVVSIFCKLLEDSGTINIMYLHLRTVYAMSSWIVKAWTEAALYGGHNAKCANLWPAEAATQQQNNMIPYMYIHYIWSSVHVEQLVTFWCLWHEDHTYSFASKGYNYSPSNICFPFFSIWWWIDSRLTCEGHTWSSSSVELNGSPPWLCY